MRRLSRNIARPCYWTQNNADLYASLAYVLSQQKKWDDAAAAAREALRLNPNNDMAHNNLGIALGSKGDWDGAIAEEREALRLNPNNDMAHVNLGVALGRRATGMVRSRKNVKPCA